MRTRSLLGGVALMGLLAGYSHGQALEGRKITLEAGDHAARYAPLSLPYTGPKPAGRLVVREESAGKTFPVTVTEDSFVFIVEGAMPNAKHTFLVEAAKEAEIPAPKVQITKKDGVDELDVRVEDKLLTTYHYSNQNKKPFLWPLLSEGDAPVTRDFPMGAKDATGDHPHQKSCWSAFGSVNGTDCWTEGGNSGYQVSKDVTFGSGDAFGWIKAQNEWQDKERKPVLSESREYRFYATPSNQRLFDLTVVFTATNGEVKFGDTKEGGIVAFRVRDEMRETAAKGGKITLSTGLTSAAAWGKPAAWCDYSGPVGESGIHGIAAFDNAANLRFPTCWHVRDYGLMGANPFGLAAFTNNAQNGDYTLKAGESLTFKYRVLVHSGDVTAAKVDDRYKDYATPPKVAWAK